MSHVRLRLRSALLLALSAGCTDYVPATAEALSIVPNSGSTAEDTRVEIRGDVVLARVRVDYSEGASAEAIARVRIWLRKPGASEPVTELRPIRLTDEKHLETVVPAGLAPGPYDVLLQDAYERERVLEKAFTVIGIDCADGLVRGEPCGASCTRIEGCECRAEDQCAPICGDGLLRGEELCDDGNAAPGDGCDDRCRTESGYICDGQPSTCLTRCGDGVAAGEEACDDGNEATGDGCTPECAVESGWRCSAAGCAPICGDGMLVGPEICEPELQRVGCAADCRPRPGFECLVVGQNDGRVVCRPICGDGVITGDEACDDRNLRPEDGCRSCQVEEGWVCEGEPSICKPICGDGRVLGGEECDPGPDDNGSQDLRRACGPDCRAAPGYECEDGICSPIACAQGDVCDDGNACTRDDVCSYDGLCRGALKPSCLTYCSATCIFDRLSGRTNCCEETCGLTGRCSDCAVSDGVPEPMCSYVCQTAECDARCREHSTCSLTYAPGATVVSGGDAELVCDSGAVCSMSCDGTRILVGSEPTCTLSCAQGAICILESCVDASCELNCQDGSLLECQTTRGRVLVCGRDCPE